MEIIVGRLLGCPAVGRRRSNGDPRWEFGLPRRSGYFRLIVTTFDQLREFCRNTSEQTSLAKPASSTSDEGFQKVDPTILKLRPLDVAIHNQRLSVIF